VQLSVGSQWTDSRGQEFIIDAICNKDEEIWVTYTRARDRTSYHCLLEAFTYRFREKIQ
jgi:hypothetical protein